jgi:hypothetical protein
MEPNPSRLSDPQAPGADRSRKLITIVIRGEVGHRREYISLFKDLALRSGHDAVVEQLSWKHVFRDGAVFSPMLEEHTLKMVSVGALRRVLGRRSAALLFGILEANDPSTLRQKMKHILLRIARLGLPGIVISIVPTSVDPRLERLASAWIYDPQLWDLGDAITRDADPLLVDLIAKSARGRRVIAAVGGQNHFKGFDYLCEVWAGSVELRSKCLFAAFGSVARESRRAAETFRGLGGMLVDRFITDGELRAVYTAADLVWSCYAPEYNQSSGIFGRAHQAGVTSLVRKGSALERLGKVLGREVVALPWNDPARAADLVLAAAATVRRPQPPALDGLRRHSLCTLERALGVKLEAG